MSNLWEQANTLSFLGTSLFEGMFANNPVMKQANTHIFSSNLVYKACGNFN